MVFKKRRSAKNGTAASLVARKRKIADISNQKEESNNDSNFSLKPGTSHDNSSNIGDPTCKKRLLFVNHIDSKKGRTPKNITAAPPLPRKRKRADANEKEESHNNSNLPPKTATSHNDDSNRDEADNNSNLSPNPGTSHDDNSNRDEADNFNIDEITWEKKYKTLIEQLQLLVNEAQKLLVEDHSNETEAKKENRKSGSGDTVAQESIYLLKKGDDNAVPLVKGYDVYIDELEKKNIEEKYKATTVVARNILGAVFNKNFLRSASLNGKPGTERIPKKTLNVLTEYVMKVQETFTEKESKSAIHLIFSKRLSEYRH